MPTYHGSCHCGRVAFEIEADVTRLNHCNCSICTKKGTLNCRVSTDRFRLLRGEDALTCYRFNTEVAEHFFCSSCGIHPFGHPRTAPDHYVVNVRCLDDFDVDSAEYEIVEFDGQNWEEAFAALRANR